MPTVMGYDKQKDHILLEKIKAGDEQSFRLIYEKYHEQLYRVALKYLRSKELAEDAVHDVFIKLWNNRKKLEKSGSLKGFLFTTAKNHVLNMLSRNKRKVKKHILLRYERKVSRMEPANVIALSEYRGLYRQAVKERPPKRREVFKLRTDEGLTNREAAQFLDISVHTVKSQYYKASNFIRDYVNERISSRTGT